MPFDATNFADQQALDDLFIIERVRHRIRRPQLWCRNTLAAGNRVCIMGAIARAFGASQYELRTMNDQRIQQDVNYNRMVAIIQSYVPGFMALADYNDDFSVNHADVMHLFDSIIVDYRKRLHLELTDAI